MDAGTEWIDVKWTSNTGLSSTEQKIVVKDAGQYKLEVVNNQGCAADDVFLLETSYDLLKASFLIPKEAMVGDTVVMVDISWPLSEKIDWNFPPAMKKVAEIIDIVYGQFNEPGSYTVGMTAYLGECRDYIAKTITILESTPADEGGRLGYEKFVKEFTLYPNPNDGSFEVGVELLEESAITLNVWSTLTSYMIGKVKDEGEKLYKKWIDLRSLPSGTYVLRLDHARGKDYIRFVVH